MILTTQETQGCHPERSEGSDSPGAQDDSANLVR